MKTDTIFGYIVASAAVASAQVTYHPNGTYTCAESGAAYCAGGSLRTDIIIRCNGYVGQPGRCSNNLAGQPPIGNFPSLCWEPSPDSGQAACEKNCVVYGGSGNFNGTFTLPTSVCTPTYTATTSTQTHTTNTTITKPTTTTTSYSNSTTITHSGTTITQTDTTITVPPTTVTTGPTRTPPPVTAGAASNQVTGVLAAVGVIAAYLL